MERNHNPSDLLKTMLRLESMFMDIFFKIKKIPLILTSILVSEKVIYVQCLYIKNKILKKYEDLFPGHASLFILFISFK